MLLRHLHARSSGEQNDDFIDQVLHRPKLIDRVSCGCHNALHDGSDPNQAGTRKTGF